jgi:anaerobic selenocysteine-containing dehydrogenase
VAEIKGYTPEWAAEQCDVSAELIRAAGREFASHRPAPSSTPAGASTGTATTPSAAAPSRC